MKPYRDKFDIRKTLASKNGVKYRIRKETGGNFKLEYLAPMMTGSTRAEWRLVGEFQTFQWADDHLKEMETLLGGKGW